VTGLTFEKGIITLLMAAGGLSVASLLVKPIVNVLLLPLNLVTFGLFRWLSSAIALYLVTLVVEGFKVENFFFQGFSTTWFDIPTISLSGILSLIAFSLLISVISSVIHKIYK